MIPLTFSSTDDNLEFVRFDTLSDKERLIIGNSWDNPFNARYNHMRDPYGSVNEIATYEEPPLKDNYFRVVRKKDTQEIVGTCRFGKYHAATDNNTWDFGFNILLRHWFNGYGAEILRTIIELAKKEKVKTIIGGADIENFGSYKAMVKNGFQYDDVDNMGDYRYILDVKSHTPPTQQQIKDRWDNHMAMAKKDLGEKKVQLLEYINKEIFKLVQEIKAGGNEIALTKAYYDKLSELEPFKFS